MKDKKLRKNIKKRLARIFLNVVLVILIIPFSLTLMFNDPMVQTLTARLATYYLSLNSGHNIAIDAIQIHLLDGIKLKGIVLDDYKGNNILRIDQLKAKPLYSAWDMKGLAFHSVDMEAASFSYGRYKGDADFAFMLLLDSFSVEDTSRLNENSPRPFSISVKNLRLSNSRFHYFDEETSYDNGRAMDYADILIDNIQMEGHDFSLVGDSIDCRIEHLSGKEQSGIIIDNMKVDYSLSSKRMQFKNTFIETKASSIDVDFEMRTKSFSTYSYFIDSVVMAAKVRPTNLDLSEIGFFAEIMFQMTDRVGLTGEVLGTVQHLKGENILIHYGNDTRFSGDVQMTGLPDFYTTYIVADIRELSTTACDLKTFAIPGGVGMIDLTDKSGCDELISLSGDLKGYYGDFTGNFRLKNMGSTTAASIVFYDKPGDSVSIHATIESDSLYIGKLTGMESTMGRIKMNAAVDLRGKDWNRLDIQSTGYISSMEFLGYSYKRIKYETHYRNNELSTQFRIGDKHLMMNGAVDINFDAIPALSLRASIINADMDALHLWNNDLSLSTKLQLQLQGFDVNTMTGWLTMDTTQLRFGTDVYPLQQLKLDKYYNEEENHVLNIASDYGVLNLEGRYKIMTLADQIIDLLDHYYSIREDDFMETEDPLNFVNIDAHIFDGSLIFEQLLPGLYLSPSTGFSSKMDFNKHLISADLNADEIRYLGVLFKNNHLLVNSNKDGFDLNYTIEEAIFKDSTPDDQTVFGLDDLHLLAHVSDNQLKYGVYWDNEDGLVENYGVIEGNIAQRKGITKAQISKSEVVINDTLWSIDPDNLLVYDSVGLSFKKIVIYGGVSRLMIRGILPQHEHDSLRIEFDEWNLSNFDMLTKNLNFDMDGIIDGYCDISILSGNPAIISDITINQFVFNKEYLGTARIFNTWDNVKNSVFVKSQIVRSGDAGMGEVFSINGYYYPFVEDEPLNLEIEFNRFKLAAFEPFLASYVTKIEGLASGNLQLRGSFYQPVLTGSLEMKRTSLLINYLNTKYSFSNTISFEPDRINFDELVIYDTLGNTANINGNLLHHNFNNPVFDVGITTDKFLFFNTTRKMNDLYYGTALMKGKVSLKGSPDDVRLQIDATTGEGTDVSLPLEYSVEISDQDYIVFVNTTLDSIYEKESKDQEKLAKEAGSAYEINLRMNINPAAKVSIFMPSDMGKIISQGHGDLAMRTNSDGDLSLIGDYNIESGQFHFTIGNLINKRFELVRGGRISWTGDPYEANVSIKGLYKTKANLNSLGILVSDSSSIKNRVEVECYVILSNQLLDPDINFQIKLPSLDPDLQRAVYAVLDTTNVAMMNEQMISLLVLGSFSYSNASNLTVGSSYYTVLTNQLSGMLSQISDAFDIGLNYKPGDEISQEEFEVALSTQLFDNRLTIDGNFGMTYDRNQQNTSSIVGDVDVGYKLTKSGRWVLKAFNHSNSNSWYNYAGYDKVSPYTQGIGIAFRKDFDNIAELFQRSRKRKTSNEGENRDSNEITPDAQ